MVWCMDPLIKKLLLRILGFLLLVFLSSWLFVLVEKMEENDIEVKYQLLRSLYDSMASKYNMSIVEFNNFSNVAYEALSEPKSQWNYNDAMDFVIQTVSTIGKAKKKRKTGGTRYSAEFSVRMCGAVLQTLTLFQTKKMSFSNTTFQTWPLKFILVFKPK